MESTLRVKSWGNGLGVRLTANVARAAGLEADAQVALTVEDGRITIERVQGAKRTLAEKLAAYDPVKHGGEFLMGGRVGVEVM